MFDEGKSIVRPADDVESFGEFGACGEVERLTSTARMMVVLLAPGRGPVVLSSEPGETDLQKFVLQAAEAMPSLSELDPTAEVRSVSMAAQRVEFGRIAMDVASHQAWAAGEELKLTRLEFRLLCHFCQHSERVLARTELLKSVWGIRGKVSTRTVDTHVKRLRSKLARAGNYIRTVRCVGYRLALPASDHLPSSA